MPKLIENVREKILAEADRQLAQVGYAGMTISSLAKACGVGVGTVYNYFPSKEAVLTACIADEWQHRMEVIRNVATYSETHGPVVRCIYDQVKEFALAHGHIFRDSLKTDTVYAILLRFSWRLCDQIAVFMEKFCVSEGQARMVAEAMNAWLWSEKSMDEICAGVDRLLK